MIIVLAVFALFMGYESYKVRNEINSAMVFWTVAVDQARSDKITTDEFYSKYDDLGDIVSDSNMPGPTLVQRVRLTGRLCTDYSIRVYYSSRGDDSANLMMISGRRHGKFCFF